MPEFKDVSGSRQILMRDAILYKVYRERARNVIGDVPAQQHTPEMPQTPETPKRAGTPKLPQTAKRGRRAAYPNQVEQAIRILFREHITAGFILISEVRAKRNAYPDLSQHLRDFSDAQITEKVWEQIKKINN